MVGCQSILSDLNNGWISSWASTRPRKIAVDNPLAAVSSHRLTIWARTAEDSILVPHQSGSLLRIWNGRREVVRFCAWFQNPGQVDASSSTMEYKHADERKPGLTRWKWKVVGWPKTGESGVQSNIRNPWGYFKRTRVYCDCPSSVLRLFRRASLSFNSNQIWRPGGDGWKMVFD